MNPWMIGSVNAIRRNLAAAYNRHVDELIAANADKEVRESCCEIGNCIAGILALSSNEGIASDEGIEDLSDEVTLRSPFGDD